MRSILVLVLVAAAAPAASLAQEQGDDEAEKASSKSDFDIGAELSLVYTSNVYREQARRLDNFDSDSDPGERFEDMEGPADFYARPGVALGWSNKVASKRRFELSAGAEFTAYARNGIADYLRVEAGTSYDVTKHDRLELEVDFIPRRFKENYYNDIGGNKVFDRAYYMQIAPAVGYRREWTKHWATELEYELSLRRYEEPFPHRDMTTHAVQLLLARELSDRVTVKMGPEVAVARVPRHMEFGAEVDRSHWDVGGVGALELNLPHRWAAEGEVEYKRKTYPSDDPLDDAHHDRADDAFAAEAEIEKGMNEVWYLGGTIGFTKVLSDRIDPTVDADEYGYTELVVGVGGQAKF